MVRMQTWPTFNHHTDSSQATRRRPLAERIGAEAAAAVSKALTGTADEWMLDVEREYPPGIDDGYERAFAAYRSGYGKPVEVPGTSVWWGKGRWAALNGETADEPALLKEMCADAHGDDDGDYDDDSD